MEDFELSHRLRKNKQFKVINKDIVVSARKYEKNSYLRVQIANLIVFAMFRLSIPPTQLANTYRRLLK